MLICEYPNNKNLTISNSGSLIKYLRYKRFHSLVLKIVKFAEMLKKVKETQMSLDLSVNEISAVNQNSQYVNDQNVALY